MCGIAGFWAPEGLSSDPAQLLSRMAERLGHRGPDGAGQWLEADRRVGLAHRRLAVIDPSPAGAQPMVSPSGRYVAVYNGEIYNHPALRSALESTGRSFRSSSDTEVMLGAFDADGVLGGIGRCVGMFALAVVDTVERRLHLVRDRFGEKPLYYGWIDGVLVFASELKALRAMPGWDLPIDRAALTLYLRHNYIPAPHSIFEGIAKVEPGTVVTFDLAGGARTARVERYWSALEAAAAGRVDPLQEPAAALERIVWDRLRDTVRAQMMADVPLGAFLSGGIDSSLIVALMQEVGARPTRTFSIGFRETDYDEAPHARAIAAHLGTDHTELYVTAAEAQAVVPRLPRLYDEPFADSSQIPTCLVSALARRSVTVSISGDGGDELFGGYARYRRGRQLLRGAARLGPLRRGLARILRSRSAEAWNNVLRLVSWLLPTSRARRVTGARLRKLADLMTYDSTAGFYRELVSHWREPTRIVIGGWEPRQPFDTIGGEIDGWPVEEVMMLLDVLTYLPGDILVKVDRAAMGVSLETRAPFLDHRLYELAWRMPGDQRYGHPARKRMLRSLLARYVPAELFDRPKMGFGVPIGEWLRGPLREWGGDLLARERLRREGYFEPDPIVTRWREHLDGQRNWQYQLWGVLMFEAWLECWNRD